MATSLEGFSVSGREKGVPGAPFKGVKGYEGHPLNGQGSQTLGHQQSVQQLLKGGLQKGGLPPRLHESVR